MAATRLPYIRMILGGRFPQGTKALHQQYGDVVRIAPDELSFIDGAAWKPIYGTRVGHGQKSKDHRFYAPTPGEAPSIIVSNDADHSRFRRLLSHAFSESTLRSQETIIKGYIDLLMQRLHENIDGGTSTVDMVAWYNFTTFDIIGDLAFGEPFDCLKNSEYHQWVSIIFSSLKYGAYANVSVWPSSQRLFEFVSVSHLTASHSPANFADAEQFIPERHLDNPRFANDSKTAMEPFSFGPRNCIGRDLTYVKMRIILTRMVFNFDRELDQPEKNWMDRECFVLWNKPKLMVKLKPRVHSKRS
ncbi:unnamed protein product [Penicillium nalgiovense]|nr:unnamed protein product [Penicillium nalgiovense]